MTTERTDVHEALPEAGDYDPLLASCRLCGSTHLHPYHRDDKDRRIQRCSGCGIQFMNPQYTDDYLARYYSTYIRVEPETEEPNRYRHDYNFDLIEKRCGGPGRVLDIGCGRGYLLRMARERGWETVGYDVDPDTVAAVAEEFDLELHSGDFMDLDLEPESFDAVTMHHVLEHMKDPVPALRKSYEALRPDGWLFVALPNIEGLSSSIKFSLETMGLRRRSVGSYYDADHHLFYFSPTTLEKLLADQGFRVTYRQSTPKVRAGDSARLRTLRRYTTDRLLLRSSFLMLAEKIG